MQISLKHDEKPEPVQVNTVSGTGATSAPVAVVLCGAYRKETTDERQTYFPEKNTDRDDVRGSSGTVSAAAVPAHTDSGFAAELMKHTACNSAANVL